jgi:hypothetical protein
VVLPDAGLLFLLQDGGFAPLRRGAWERKGICVDLIRGEKGEMEEIVGDIGWNFS